MRINFNVEVEPQEVSALLQSGMTAQQMNIVLDAFNQIQRKLGNISYNVNKQHTYKAQPTDVKDSKKALY